MISTGTHGSRGAFTSVAALEAAIDDDLLRHRASNQTCGLIGRKWIRADAEPGAKKGPVLRITNTCPRSLRRQSRRPWRLQGSCPAPSDRRPAAVRLQVGQRKIDALRKIGKRHPVGNVGRIRSRHGVGRCIFEKTVTRSASHRDCRTTSGWRGRWRRERRSQCQRRSDRRGVLSMRRVSDPFGRIRRHTTCPPSRPEGFDRAQRLPAISRLAS